MGQETIKEEIKLISIRGRVALGIVCLEKYLDKINLTEDLRIQRITKSLWAFASTDDIEYWDTTVTQYELNHEGCPVAIEIVFIEDKRHVFNYNDLYKNAPKDLSEFISSIIKIGINNIYSGTGLYSETTLTPTLEVLDLMDKNSLEIPSLEIFKKSSFKEKHGWGLKQNPSFFK